MPPPSQTLRQISFYLEGGVDDPVLFTFGVRPEDLTRAEPSRLNVQKTLGGAWLDSFDRGVSDITLSGNNGWRGTFGLSGEAMFAALRDTVFVSWHQRRADSIQFGLDPDTVQLTFTDSLDSIRALVAPRSFQLRRSRSKPLLMDYTIQLAVLDDAQSGVDDGDPIVQALNNPLRWALAVTGIGNALATLGTVATTACAALGTGAAIANAAIGTAQSICEAVQTTGQALQGQFDPLNAPLLQTAMAVTLGLRNGWYDLVDVTQPPAVLLAMMQVAGALNDLYCAMATGLNLGRYYANYAALEGASGCSSTGGGAPASSFAVAGTNPFDAMYPAGAAVLSVSSAATSALSYLSGDPLNLTNQQIIASMQAIGDGITLL